MSNPMTDVAEIARGLTKAQREALIDAPSNWIALARCRAATLQALKGKGIISQLCFLTPLGLEVRAHLTQEQPR